MNILKNLPLALITVAFFNCSSDDDLNTTFTPSTNDYSITIDENPINGLLIGTIPSSTTSSTNYTITSQSINNALRIDSSSGNLIVNDAYVFDFETSPLITATVKNLENNNITNVSINLNNVDDIQSFLTTSKASYIATEDSSWVQITQTEYELLAERLNYVSTLGSTNNDYQTATATAIDNVTVTNVGGSPNLPPNNYFFGFKYHAMSDNVVGARVKISVTDPLYGFLGWGRYLPEHDSGDNYFVLKNDLAFPVSEDAYIAVYTPGDIGHINSTADKTCYGTNGDSTSIPADNISTGIIYLYQGLYTSQKQWGI
ncbi:hypothetical protein ACW5R3_00855 [Bizionia sp. KMM 8389]